MKRISFFLLSSIKILGLILLLSSRATAQESLGKGAPPRLDIINSDLKGNILFVNFNINYGGMVEIYLYKNDNPEKIIWFDQYVKPDGTHSVKLRYDKLVKKYGKGSYTIEMKFKGKAYTKTLSL